MEEGVQFSLKLYFETSCNYYSMSCTTQHTTPGTLLFQPSPPLLVGEGELLDQNSIFKSEHNHYDQGLASNTRHQSETATRRATVPRNVPHAIALLSLFSHRNESCYLPPCGLDEGNCRQFDRGWILPSLVTASINITISPFEGSLRR